MPFLVKECYNYNNPRLYSFGVGEAKHSEDRNGFLLLLGQSPHCKKLSSQREIYRNKATRTCIQRKLSKNLLCALGGGVSELQNRSASIVLK